MSTLATMDVVEWRIFMVTQDEGGTTRLAVEIEPELRTRIEAVAAEQDMSVRDYVVAVLRAAVDHYRNGWPDDSHEWSRLSAPALARDWESNADAVYDELRRT